MWVFIQNIQWSGLLFIKYLGRANNANVEEYSGLRIQRGIMYLSIQENMQNKIVYCNFKKALSFFLSSLCCGQFLNTVPQPHSSKLNFPGDEFERGFQPALVLLTIRTRRLSTRRHSINVQILLAGIA